MKVKLIRTNYAEDLEESINTWIKEKREDVTINFEVIDIKYNTSIVSVREFEDSQTLSYHYSALIMYQE